MRVDFYLFTSTTAQPSTTQIDSLVAYWAGLTSLPGTWPEEVSRVSQCVQSVFMRGTHTFHDSLYFEELHSLYRPHPLHSSVTGLLGNLHDGDRQDQ